MYTHIYTYTCKYGDRERDSPQIKLEPLKKNPQAQGYTG